MKRSSLLYGVLTGFLGYTIGAFYVSDDFVCDDKVIPQLYTSRAVANACDDLINSQKKTKFPAVYDGSSTYLVSDAILFSWSISVEGEIGIRGKSEDLRLIMDSGCNLFGIVIKTNTSPDRRCYQPTNPPREFDFYDSRMVGKLPGFRGYKCSYKLFGTMQIEDLMKEAYKNYKLWESWGSVTGSYEHEAIEKLFEKNILLLPSEISKYSARATHISFNSNLMIVDSQYQLLGMVTKVGNQWEKCLGLWEKEPERPQSVDSTRNSIGERLFTGVREYKCGRFVYPRASVNSHMQVACTLIKPPDGYSRSTWNTYLTAVEIMSSAGRLKLWKMNLRLPEIDEYDNAARLSNNGVVILDEECNFYGVYWYNSKHITECDDQSLLPASKRQKNRS